MDDHSSRELAATAVGRRFPSALMYSAATLYYLEDASQAEIAKRLGTSRATVSRVLSEARRQGIVRIEVVSPPVVDHEALSKEVAKSLRLEAVHIVSNTSNFLTGSSLASGLFTALEAAELSPGDVLLVSSGRTIYEVAQAELPTLPGVVVAPMIGGYDEPEAWYQPNEIARQFARKIDGHPALLYAPALPGPGLHQSLLMEPSIQRVMELWRSARCAVVGIGAPPLTRRSLPRFIPTDAMSLREAVGDVCSRFYDRQGELVPFPGSECLMSTGLDVLREIPMTIGVAVGMDKLLSIAVGAQAGYFNRLVTDAATGTALVSQESTQRTSSRSRAGQTQAQTASSQIRGRASSGDRSAAGSPE